jgi:antitoxin (DNA-binding transcriptional repressor) of toxin-antitoxin stability system
LVAMATGLPVMSSSITAQFTRAVELPLGRTHLVLSDLDCGGSRVLGEVTAPTATDGSSGRRTFIMLEAQTHLARLVEAIETGAATEVVIARNGRPVARLTALTGPERPRCLGVARGQFTVPESIDAANPLIAELFEQA